jgi:diguanylate cyclase (GGDEF)-like protein/PAS domain S-box-containing protein
VSAVATAGDTSDEHEALLHFLYVAPVGLAQTALNGDVVMMNPVSAQLLMPLSPAGDLTNLFEALEDVAPELRSLTARFGKPTGTVCSGLRIQLNGGRPIAPTPYMLSLTLLKLDELRLMAVLTDVSEEVRRERLLQQNEAWISAILTGITDYAVVSLDRHGCMDDWNPSIGRVTGFDRAALVGQSYAMLYPNGGTTPERVLDLLREADENGWSLDDGWRKKADGSRFWGNAMIYPLRPLTERVPIDAEQVAGPDTGPPAYCLVIRDITARRDAAESTRESMACDHLTGIANRRTFFEAAEFELARWRRLPRPLSLVLFDADHFKKVNDSHGHPAGDSVLRHFAATLTATFRDCDLVARIGGEEFAVLLPSTTQEQAELVAERLLRAVESGVVEVDGAQIRYTVSGGIATMNVTITGLDDLMKRADQALYAAKHGGRNRLASWSAAYPPPASTPGNA